MNLIHIGIAGKLQKPIQLQEAYTVKQKCSNPNIEGTENR